MCKNKPNLFSLPKPISLKPTQIYLHTAIFSLQTALYCKTSMKSVKISIEKSEKFTLIHSYRLHAFRNIMKLLFHFKWIPLIYKSSGKTSMTEHVVALIRAQLLIGKDQGRSTNWSIVAVQLIYENGQFPTISHLICKNDLLHGYTVMTKFNLLDFYVLHTAYYTHS